MIGRLIVIGLLAGCVFPGRAADLCAPTRLHKEWSAQCFEVRDGARRVRQDQLKHLDVDKDGMTTIVIESPRELVAVNRAGDVVVPGIRHTGDFDYPASPSGIGRFDAVHTDAFGKETRQCGYFRIAGFRIIVPAHFDHCTSFKEHEALACTDCAAYCTETDCQDSVYVGGRGVIIGRDGNTRRSMLLPTLENVCKARKPVQIGNLANGAQLLKCAQDAHSPFNHP